MICLCSAQTNAVKCVCENLKYLWHQPDIVLLVLYEQVFFITSFIINCLTVLYTALYCLSLLQLYIDALMFTLRGFIQNCVNYNLK